MDIIPESHTGIFKETNLSCFGNSVVFMDKEIWIKPYLLF